MTSKGRPGGTNPRYFSPLSSPSTFVNDRLEPAQCTFSVPKVTYSQETRDFVQLLIKETRLTTTQRRGFESLLRSNDPLPEPNSAVLARKQEYLRRRAEKGRALGLEIPVGRKFNKMNQALCAGGGKRTLETIQATGVFQSPEPKPRTYIPVNKELEKVRLSYKMAYGVEPSSEVLNRLMGVKTKPTGQVKVKKSEEDLKHERLNELIEEIRERVDFLETMKSAKRDKAYHASMTFQIRQKLDEVKGQFPEKVKELVETFRLSEIDPVFTASG